MFGALKRLMHRGGEEDYDSLRSHILGERPFEPMPVQQNFQQPPQMAQPMQAAAGFDDFSPKTRDVFEPFPTNMASMAPAFPDTRPALERTAERTSRDYEIVDRLDIIESQLAVIRSQTETINERLKNMEGKLGMQRRY